MTEQLKQNPMQPMQMDEFISEGLAQRVVGSRSEKVCAPERYGERYPAYLRLVISYAAWIDLPPSKCQPQMLEKLEAEAQAIGFSPREIVGLGWSARSLYAKWLVYKHRVQMRESEGRVLVKGGTDPHVALGDRSHRKDLGYISSERE